MISLIAAVDRNFGIGKAGNLPFRLPADLKFFKEQTLGGTVVMGRKTAESIGRPLPNRRNIVLSRDKGLEMAGFEVVNTVEEALALDDSASPLWIIGGGEIYSLMLPYAQRIVLTEVSAEVDCDTFFPRFDLDDWCHPIIVGGHLADSENEFAFKHCIYIRRTHKCD